MKVLLFCASLAVLLTSCTATVGGPCNTCGVAYRPVVPVCDTCGTTYTSYSGYSHYRYGATPVYSGYGYRVGPTVGTTVGTTYTTGVPVSTTVTAY